MKQALTRDVLSVYHYENGVKIKGVHAGIRGDVSGIWGNVSGIRGNVSGISGDVDNCNISAEERSAGVDIARLVKP